MLCQGGEQSRVIDGDKIRVVRCRWSGRCRWCLGQHRCRRVVGRFQPAVIFLWKKIVRQQGLDSAGREFLRVKCGREVRCDLGEERLEEGEEVCVELGDDEVFVFVVVVVFRVLPGCGEKSVVLRGDCRCVAEVGRGYLDVEVPGVVADCGRAGVVVWAESIEHHLASLVTGFGMRSVHPGGCGCLKKGSDWCRLSERLGWNRSCWTWNTKINLKLGVSLSNPRSDNWCGVCSREVKIQETSRRSPDSILHLGYQSSLTFFFKV